MSDEHYGGHDPLRGCGLMVVVAIAVVIVAIVVALRVLS